MSSATPTTVRAPLVFDHCRLDAIPAADWQALYRRSGTDNVFYDRAIVHAAAQVWPEQSAHHAIIGRRDGALAFVQPHRLARGPLGRTIELLEVPTADRVEPLFDDADADAVLADYRDYLLDTLAPDLVIARSITERLAGALSTRGPVLRGQAVGRADRAGWYIDLPDTLDDYWAGCRASFRAQLRRRLRAAERAGVAHSILIGGDRPFAPQQAPQQALRRLRELHRLRFRSLGRSSFFLRPQFVAFHDRLVAGATPECRPFFTELTRGNETIASLYGVHTADCCVFLMLGFDPAHGRLSPGSVLLFRTIEYLIAAGVSRFDLKCGDEDYKSRWATGAYRSVDLHLLRTGRGRLLHGLRRARTLTQRRYRSLLGR